MGYFAKVENSIVTNVIIADQDFINTLEDKELWVETVLDYGPNVLRKNYAGIGYTYDSTRDAFIAPRPFPSWPLNESTCTWYPPVDYPTEGGPYVWDEAILNWVLAPQ